MKLLGMEVKKGAVNDNRWLVNIYPSLTKFQRYLEANEHVKTCRNYSHDGEYSFSKSRNFAEALSILKTGSDEIKAGLKDAVKHAISDLNKELHSIPEGYVADVEGLFFDVAKVVEDEPEAWYREPFNKTKKPRIRVPILGTYNAGFKAQTAIENASQIIALIKAMGDRGIEVEMVMVFFSKNMTCDSYHGLTAVTVKGYDEKFNWSKLSAMLHPSFFRRCVFRDSELQAPQTLAGSYGSDFKTADVFEGGENMLKISDKDTIRRFKEQVLESLKGKKNGSK